MTEQINDTTQTIEQPVLNVTDQTTQASNEEATVVDQNLDTTTQTQNNDDLQQPAGVPETADQYKVEVDGFDFDSFKQDNADVIESFHKAGMNNEQLTEVVKAWDNYQQVNIENLKEEWGDQYGQNINYAKHAISALGFTPEQMNSPTAVIQLASAIGKQLQEDLAPQNTQQNGSETIEQLMMSEAYLNPQHPDHKRVYSQVERQYQQKYKG